LVYVDDVNLLGNNICRYHEENIQILTDARKEVGLEVNPKKTKCLRQGK
jgi:hypothetical protein